MGWIEDKTRTFEYNGVKYYTRTDDDGGDKGQIQVWNAEDGRHLGTFPKDKTKKFEKNVNIFDYDPVTDEEIKDIRNDPKFAKATRAASKDTVITVTRKACMDKTNADGSSNSAADCQAKAEKVNDELSLNDDQLEAQNTAENENKGDADADTADADTADAADGDNETSQFSEEETKDINADVGREDYGGDMIYPLGRHDTQDYMLFEVLKYTPRGLKNSDGSGGPLKSRANKTDKGERKPIAIISLPIPANIQDTNVVDWQKDDIDEMQKQMANLTSSAIEGNVSEGVQEVKEGVKKEGSLKAVTEGLKNTITGVKAMQREKGAVFNENTELLFNGPGMRSFSFSFRLSPRSADEAKMVRRIIRTFKESMSAKKSKQFFFIKAPNTYWISYMSGITKELHPWLNKIKECALTNMTVQYAPDGNYSTFSDGSMTSYMMQLSFKEIEPVFNTDYEEGKKDEIGY